MLFSKAQQEIWLKSHCEGVPMLPIGDYARPLTREIFLEVDARVEHTPLLTQFLANPVLSLPDPHVSVGSLLIERKV
jgi:hypothetical protein